MPPILRAALTVMVFWVLIGLIVAIGFLIGELVGGGGRQEVTPREIARIHLGDSRAAVERRLGRPDFSTARRGRRCWHYKLARPLAGSTDAPLCFSGGKLVSKP